MPKIVEPEWRLNTALPQRPLMRRLEFGHWPRPVVPAANPSWKEILALCPRNPPIENRQCSRGDRNIPHGSVRLPFLDMHIGRGRLDAHILASKLKDLAGAQPHLDHDDPDIPEHGGCGFQVFSLLIEGECSLPSLFMQELHAPAEERTLLDRFLLY